MIFEFTTKNSRYEIDPKNQRYRKVGDGSEWKLCTGAYAAGFELAEGTKYGTPILGCRYWILRGSADRDMLTSVVMGR